MMTVVLDNCRMKDWKIGDRTADIQDGAVHGIGEHNFPWLELATRNQNGFSNKGFNNWNFNKNAGWRNFCSFVHKIN
jgi:hypothetical protein